MSDTMQLTTTEPTQHPSPIPSASIVQVEGGNLELSAQSPDEIVQCHEAMIRWAQRKVELMQGEAKELELAYLHAKKSKWRFSTLEKQWKITERRVEFYKKMLSALQAGYHIIPPMPLSLFAIRTEKKRPKADYALYRYVNSHDFEQEAQVLDAGEGEYKNPQPQVKQDCSPTKVQEGTQMVEKWHVWADQWDEMEFPANMARVHVMQATSRAMALKVFDDLGMLPEDRKRNPDPMIIGRIHDPRNPGYGTRKMVYFLIGWHIDTRSL